MSFLFKAHRGMIACAQFMLKSLEEASILEKAFAIYPRYKLVITGLYSNEKFIISERNIVIQNNKNKQIVH